MTFADLPVASPLFVDANVLVYHFEPHATYGTACTDFLERVERQEIPRYGIQTIDTASGFIDMAAGISQQTGLLHNDALIIAIMRHHGLTNLASEDADFDRVPGITRYSPV